MSRPIQAPLQSNVASRPSILARRSRALEIQPWLRASVGALGLACSVWGCSTAELAKSSTQAQLNDANAPSSRPDGSAQLADTRDESATSEDPSKPPVGGAIKDADTPRATDPAKIRDGAASAPRDSGAVTPADASNTGNNDAGSSCENVACLRAFECAEACGGEVLYSGCCACEAPLIDIASECPKPENEVACGARAGNTCAEDEYCAYEEGQYCGAADASALCKPRPFACTRELQPVCGCDGKNYNNRCEAASHGTGVLHSGDCVQNNDCGLRECLRNVRCAADCGGDIVQEGCCPCPDGTIDVDVMCRN